MANVIVPFTGASARDVEQLVSTPLEQKLSEIEGDKHVYWISRPGMAVLTVVYQVGIERQPVIVRLYRLDVHTSELQRLLTRPYSGFSCKNHIPYTDIKEINL